MNIFKAIVTALIVLATPASAQNFVELGKSGEWTVSLSEGSEDRMICSMSSNAAKQNIGFFMNSYPDGSYNILISNAASHISGNPVFRDTLLEITHPMMSETWIMKDTQFLSSDGNFSIFFQFSESGTPHGFLRDLKDGYFIHLIIEEKYVQSFSLYGASKAVDLLKDCHELIKSES